MKYALYIGWGLLVAAHIAVCVVITLLMSEFAAAFGGFFGWAALIACVALLIESFVRLIFVGMHHIDRFADHDYIP